MNPSPRTAVVVLNWNGRALLEEFAPQWVATTPPDAELIVVDNGSTDDSVSYLRTHHPEIRLITFETNYGFAEGYNRAIASLPHPVIVLLNSDATPRATDWLTHPLAMLDAHPEIAAIAPKLRSYRTPEVFEYAGAAGGFVDALGYPYCRGRLFESVETDEGQYDTPLDIMWATGAALIIRRDIYLAVGGLDARFFAHQEEIDLAWRIHARGYRIVCDPASVVYHLGGASLEMNSPRKAYLNWRNNLLMLYKNLPTPRLLPTLALRLPLDLMASLIFVLSGRWRLGRAVLAAWGDFLRLRGSFAPDRATNLTNARTPASRILSPISLLFHYHLLRHRRWSDLPRH